MMFGRHLVKTWSRTQATVALSSAEAELYASVKGAAEAMGVTSLLGDFGVSIGCQLLGDASVALGIIRRHGLGRLRHVDTPFLWVQEAAAQKRVAFDKVSGSVNPADGQTKYVNKELLDRYAVLTHTKFMSDANAFGFTINATIAGAASQGEHWEFDGARAGHDLPLDGVARDPLVHHPPCAGPRGGHHVRGRLHRGAHHGGEGRGARSAGAGSTEVLGNAQGCVGSSDLVDRFGRCSNDAVEVAVGNARNGARVGSTDDKDCNTTQRAAAGTLESPQRPVSSVGIHDLLLNSPDKCHGSSARALDCILALAEQTGRRGDLQVWSRDDLASSTYRSSSNNGPEWKAVAGRVTLEKQTNRIIEA